jgi:hypothetical protein
MKILIQNAYPELANKTYPYGRDPSLKYTPGIFITEHFK